MNVVTKFAPAPEARPSETVYVQRVAVEYEYPVHFTRSLFRPDNPTFVDALERLEVDRCHRFVVFVDDGVAAALPQLSTTIQAYAEHYGDRIALACAPEVIPGGEVCKNDPELVEHLHRRLMELGIDRHSYVVAIGGGAVLDLVGYAAATAHRGIRHVRVPTTVLAQNDSGIGVKNGINTFGLKNFTGTFAPPFAVLNDLDFIETLSDRDKVAGMAEAVKVALIRDEAFFDWMERHAADLRAFEQTAMAYMIRRCAEMHLRHIASSGDPFEMGSARPLDYGHWAAHKLETLTQHELRHGEAVAIGIALDARYATRRGDLRAGLEDRICRLLEALGFHLWHPAMLWKTSDGAPALLDGLREFREHLGGRLTITLLTGIGQAEEVHEIDEDEVLRALEWLEARDRRR